MIMEPALLAYASVFAAAAVEGEVVFVAASAAATAGHLNPALVVCAGALGAAAGDQFFFQAARRMPRAWIDRRPRLARAQLAMTALVRRRAKTLILASRFLPGLRIAIPAACGTAGIPVRTFVTLNLISAFLWAATIMILVSRVGPATAAQFGVQRLPAILLSAIAVTALAVWGGRAAGRLLTRRAAHDPANSFRKPSA